MNTFEFIQQNFAKHLIELSGDPVVDTEAVLTANVPMVGKPARLASGWGIIKDGGATVQLKVAGDKHIKGGDTRTRFEAWFDELQNFSGPTLFIEFDKKPISLDQVFLTFDTRAVRICSKNGVETFDWTSEPDEDAGKVFKILHKMRTKRNA